MPGQVYNELAAQLRTETREQLRVVRDELEAAVKRDAPVQSGALRDSIYVEDFHERQSSYISRVVAPLPQATYTEVGTGEYIGAGRIYPRHARALAFYWHKIGEYMVLASVAGQPGQHWFEGQDGTAMERRLDDAIDTAFGR